MKIACAPNFRDMGGKPTLGGGHVRLRQLYRAEAIATPDEEDARLISMLDVRLVCDLRSARERESAPSHWLATTADVLPLDIMADLRAMDDPAALLRDNPGEGGAVRLMTGTYAALPQAAAGHLGTLLRRLAAGDHPVVIHCTAGKDRTGFVSAMLLFALGVAPDDILADYLESASRHSPAVLEATRELMNHHLGQAMSDEALMALASVRPDYLETSLAVIRRDHGSLDAYLSGPVGLDARTRAALVERLVA